VVDNSLECLAENLTWLMADRGFSNQRLSFVLGISRQALHRWTSAQGFPTDDNLDALCVALRCTYADLLTSERRPITMMPIEKWARRENIPVQRAKDLFALRILTGHRQTEFTTLVPIKKKAPEESKRLVLLAKRRPRWVPIFQRNFPILLKRSGVAYSEIGAAVGVQPSAVMHWVHGRNYPHRDRLPLIAETLGVSVETLAGHV
jgi:transcriptional regulator with XRE-family HTH domain